MRKNKVAKNVKEFLLDLIFMTAGSVIYAVGLNGFTAPNNIAPGGVSGIAIVLNYLFGTPVGTVILLINVPIIIWAIIEIGYKLVTKTMEPCFQLCRSHLLRRPPLRQRNQWGHFICQKSFYPAYSQPNFGR